MYKYILFLAINSILISNIALGQTVKWGQEAKTDKASGSITSLGWHEGYLYNIEREGAKSFSFGGELRLEKLTKDLKVVLSKELEEAKSYLSHFEIQGEEIVVYKTDYTRSSRKMDIIKVRFNLNGQLLGKEEIVTIELKKGYIPSGGFSSSPDGSIINLFLALTNEDKKELELVSLTFDSKTEAGFKRVDQSFTLEEGKTYATAEEYKVDNASNVYVVLKSSEKFNSDILCNHLLVLDKNGEYLLNKKLDFEDFLLTEIEVKISSNNQAYFTGMISTYNDKESLMNNGFFLFDLDQSTFEIGNFKSFVYNEEFFLSLGYKIKKDGYVKFSGLYNLEIILNDNGGGFLVANHKTNFRSSGVSNKELVVLSFSDDLTIDAPLVVPRSLNSYPPLLNGLGYLGFCRGTELHLVYTDHEDNIEEKLLEDMKDADNPLDKKAVIYIASVTPGEGVKRKILSSENEIKGYLIPDKCQSTNDKVILNVGNKKKTLYGEIKF